MPTMVKSAAFITATGQVSKTFVDLMILPDYDCWCFTFQIQGTEMRMKLPMYLLSTAYAIDYHTLRQTVTQLYNNMKSALKANKPPVELLEYAVSLVFDPSKSETGYCRVLPYTGRMERYKHSRLPKPKDEAYADPYTVAGVCMSLDKVSEVLGMASNDPCISIGKILTRPLGSDLEWQEVPALLKPQ